MKSIASCLIMCLVAILFDITMSYAADYYVDASLGKDSNPGTSMEKAWKTISKINTSTFEPGDNIYLKRGKEWEEQLTFDDSGTSNHPITIRAYGTGPNPKLKSSTTFSDWSLCYNQGSKKVWCGNIKNLKWAMGAEKDGVRIEMNGADDFDSMQNGKFYAPYNKRIFYFRNDEGDPGVLEIGTRDYAIKLTRCGYVIIDGVDVDGPGGNYMGRGSRHVKQVLIDNCDHVEVKNCAFSNGTQVGACIGNGSTNCILRNIRSYGHESTGLYVSEGGEGNKIIDCEVYNCGNLKTDVGDKGLIGIWQSPDTTIEGCFVHDNGYSGVSKLDAAISFVQSPYGIVKRCLFRNAGGTALQFAEGSDNGLAAYNIIDGWGMFSPSNMNEGIRVGGGASTSSANNIKIYNNLFINGGKTKGWWAALRIKKYENKGLKVKNNIFYDNINIYEIIARSKDKFKDWDFSNNVFYKTTGNAIWSPNKVYDYQHIIGHGNDYYSYNMKQEKNSLVADPLLSKSKRGLHFDSPCIDSGVSVGLKQDYYGNSVPSGKGVDIGPFEYQKTASDQESASDKLGPPKNIRIQITSSDFL